ncbi:MAG: hypothetical protein HGB12_12090 [Bacteroidetes bacterium]|nr:hypothetical protein [Bacteroidota bacterium]
MKFNTKKLIFNIIIFSFILLPVILWMIWVFTPQKHLNVFIMDKTVLTKEGLEHKGLDWVLTHKKYVKQNNEYYSVPEDYFGFFPLKNKKFNIKDLQKYSEKQIDSLSNYYDMAYFTDTYGIYINEWYGKKNLTEHSEKIYGGLDEKDYLFLKSMKEKKKLVMAEFNFFATPTSPEIRKKTEDLFHIQWTGWTGRYFYLLDTVKNPELPRWVIRLYKEQHHGTWPFKNSGIVFVNEDETIAILENKTHLNYEVPKIKSFDYAVNTFNIPKEINYSYWFDIILSTDSSNKVLSYYEIKTNKIGDSILEKHAIPKVFPAAFEHLKNYPFYYFCGDFTDVPIDPLFVRMKGIKYLKLFVLNESDLNDRTPFFWRYYYPMVEKILQRYYEKNLIIKTSN